MDVVDKIVNIIGSSREMAGYSTFSARSLDNLRSLLLELKEEIKTELREELEKIAQESEQE